MSGQLAKPEQSIEPSSVTSGFGEVLQSPWLQAPLGGEFKASFCLTVVILIRSTAKLQPWTSDLVCMGCSVLLGNGWDSKEAFLTSSCYSSVSTPSLSPWTDEKMINASKCTSLALRLYPITSFQRDANWQALTPWRKARLPGTYELIFMLIISKQTGNIPFSIR